MLDQFSNFEPEHVRKLIEYCIKDKDQIPTVLNNKEFFRELQNGWYFNNTSLGNFLYFSVAAFDQKPKD